MVSKFEGSSIVETDQGPEIPQLANGQGGRAQKAVRLIGRQFFSQDHYSFFLSLLFVPTVS